MYKFIHFFTGLLIFLILSCQSEKASEPLPSTSANEVVFADYKKGPIQVYGAIQNAGNTNIKLTYQKTNRSAIIKDGKFSINHLINEPGIYHLVYNGQRIPLFLRPNDEVEINFDALQVDKTIKFSGSDPISQKYLFLKSRNNPLSRSEKRKAAKLVEADFIKQTNQIREKEKTFFAEFQKKNNSISKDFILFEDTEIQFNWAQQLNDYKLYHPFYSTDGTYTPSPEFLSYFNELELNNDALMISESYRNFLIAHVGQKASDLVQKDLMNGGKIQTSLRAFEVVEKEHDAPGVKSFLLYTFFNQHLRSQGINGSEDLYQRFKKGVTNPKYLTEVDEVFQAWKHLKKGAPAPTFQYPDTKGKQVSLNDLKGKVVYIDVWATWCGPCKTEIPHLEKLQESFHDQPVAFVSVSIDQNKAAWSKMIKEKNLTGTQLIADKAGNSQICKDYKIQGIPRFILIDQAGNIVNAQEDRPSRGTVKGKIDDLLKNNLG